MEVDSSGDYKPSADVFSLGIVVWTVYTNGNYPFKNALDWAEGRINSNNSDVEKILTPFVS